ncbi:MAG: aromatic amino acid transport family protein, partial [Candidatus Nanoarchaeia archaeon]
MVSKKLIAGAFTLSGTIIGAGILGLPYVFSQAGFLAGLFWLIFLGIIFIYINLCLGEVSLRTNQIHQIPGLAKKYLGKKGYILMIIAMLFSSYSALIAYLIGEGQSLSQLMTGTLAHAFLFSLIFWFILTLLLREGLRGLKKIETWGVFAIILIIGIIFVKFLPSIQQVNLNYSIPSNFFLPFGVVMFALLGFTAVPEIRRELGQEGMKKAILLGSIIPIILYILFSLIVVGILGKNVTEVATIAFGDIPLVLGIFTMFSSYFVHSFILKDMLHYDMKMKKALSFILTAITPLVILIILTFLRLSSFIEVISIGGIISGTLMGICILLMNKASKQKGDRKPEYIMPINKIV